MDALAKCLACGSSRWRYARELQRIARPRFSESSIWQCRQCGLGQLFPLPTSEQIDAIYRDPDYGVEYERAGEAYVVNADTFDAQQEPRLVKIREYCQTGNRLLDVGAARGVFLDRARRLGWIVAGLETDPTAIAFAAEKYQIAMISESIEKVHFDEQSFDCVHLSHVLEHLRDPVAAMARIHAWLKPGGLLVIEVPYEFGDLFDRFRKVFLRRSRTVYPVRSPHLYFFTVSSLNRMLERSGYDVREIATLRRNRSDASRLPWGRMIKRGLYGLEAFLRLGPAIEIYASKRGE